MRRKKQCRFLSFRRRARSFFDVGMWLLDDGEDLRVSGRKNTSKAVSSISMPIVNNAGVAYTFSGREKVDGEMGLDAK